MTALTPTNYNSPNNAISTPQVDDFEYVGHYGPGVDDLLAQRARSYLASFPPVGYDKMPHHQRYRYDRTRNEASKYFEEYLYQRRNDTVRWVDPLGKKRTKEDRDAEKAAKAAE